MHTIGTAYIPAMANGVNPKPNGLGLPKKTPFVTFIPLSKAKVAMVYSKGRTVIPMANPNTIALVESLENIPVNEERYQSVRTSKTRTRSK